MTPTAEDLALMTYANGRLIGLRTNRYSWWTHWRELADYELPRRYKWLITPNQQSRGSPINQHILDSTGTLAARNLASGMMSGISSPTRPWFKLKIGKVDSTQTSPISLWLAECERLMMLVFHESNFYNSIHTVYFDLVIFGTGVMLIYEDYENVIQCYNPCLGEYYLDNDGKFRPVVFYREFVYTVGQTIDEFGYDNCSDSVKALADRKDGSGLTQEIVIAHGIEPNINGRKFGFNDNFETREFFWEWGGTASPQASAIGTKGFLRKRGFLENPCIAVRWDLVSNDAYGRSPAMDALGDIKQLQQETRRKAQAIDKLVNPPMVADASMKNQPASLLPGGITYINGMAQGKVGFAPAYETRPPVQEIMEDLNEVRERIKNIFFNNLFQMISQFEPKSNITATEIDARRSEQLIMLGPVLERIYDEGIKPIIERTWAIMERAGILPEAPAEIAGQPMNIEFISMLALAQAAAQTAGIERIFSIAGNLAGVDPSTMDNIDIDYALDKYSDLLNNDPKLIRSPAALAAIRQARAKQQQAKQAQEQGLAMAQGAKTLSETQVGGGKNALQMMTGVG